MFYADETVMSNGAVRQFIAAPGSGWEVVAFQTFGPQTWALLEKSTAPSFSQAGILADIVPPGNLLTLGTGWYDFERYEGLGFRWVNNDAVLTFRELQSGKLNIMLEVGPGNVQLPLQLTALVDGDSKGQTFDVSGRQTLTVASLPDSGVHTLRFHASGDGKPLPTDQRILRFRVFKIASPSRTDTTLRP
jgi:hypothetical protein